LRKCRRTTKKSGKSTKSGSKKTVKQCVSCCVKAVVATVVAADVDLASISEEDRQQREKVFETVMQEKADEKLNELIAAGVVEDSDESNEDLDEIEEDDEDEEEDDTEDDTEDDEDLEEEEETDEYTRSRRNPFLGNQFEDEFTPYTTGQTETKLHLNKFIHQTTIKVTDQGITATTGSQSPIDEYEQMEQGYGRLHHGGLYNNYESEELLNSFDEITGFNRREPTGQKMIKANRAFAFVVKHNPTNQLVMVGRVIDAAQKKVNDVHQTINNVDQL